MRRDTPRRIRPERITPERMAFYRQRAKRLRDEAWRSMWRGLWALLMKIFSRRERGQTDAPLAFGRRRCSSSRGMISTKLQGRVR